jgi:DNA-binding LytR/AlgR family response regulator
MRTIYVIEDNNLFSTKLVGFIKESPQFSQNFYSDLIPVTDNFTNFIQDFSEHSSENLYIVDVDLEDGINGFQVAKAIREKDVTGYIIFITMHVEMMSQVFVHNLKALDYINKNDPVLEQKLLQALKHIENELNTIDRQQKEASLFKYKYKNTHLNIAMDDIVSIETNVIKRGLVLNTQNESLPCSMNLKEIEGKLPDYFVKSHRSCILNVKQIEKITYVSSNMVAKMKNGTLLPISRNNGPKVLEVFNAN